MSWRHALPPILLAITVAGLIAWSNGRSDTPNQEAAKTKAPVAQATTPVADTKGKVEKVVKTDQEWKEILSPEQYRVLRQKGTEIAFTGKYWNAHGHGVYRCAGCGLELFSSDTKFKSGTGWPSFYQPSDPEHVDTHSDRTLGMDRNEVTCSRCGGHLGHVFEDGPKPTGLRYCINSAALEFVEKAPVAHEAAKTGKK